MNSVMLNFFRPETGLGRKIVTSLKPCDSVEFLLMKADLRADPPSAMAFYRDIRLLKIGFLGGQKPLQFGGA